MQLQQNTTAIKITKVQGSTVARDIYDLLRGALGDDVFDHTVRVHEYATSVTVTVSNHALAMVVEILDRSHMLRAGELDPKPQHPWLK